MYHNLKAEIARGGWTAADLAKATGMSGAALSQKINGKSDFKLSEMMALREALHAENLTLDFLFERDEAEG